MTVSAAPIAVELISIIAGLIVLKSAVSARFLEAESVTSVSAKNISVVALLSGIQEAISATRRSACCHGSVCENEIGDVAAADPR